MTIARTPTPLRDVLYEFSLAKPVPDADLLEEFIRRYPHNAAALTEFAIELVLDARGSNESEVDGASNDVSPAVSRAMSAFQNRLYSVRQADGVAKSPAASSASVNPFLALDRSRFRDLARRLNANSAFVLKLRDRQIDPRTMTDGFQINVAKELDVPLEVLVTHFAGRPELGVQSYKAEGKPEVGAQQSLEDAVRGSGLTAEQQEYLLNL